MKDIETTSGINLDDDVNKNMSYITFSELVKELTGATFEEVYKDYLIHGEKSEQNNME